MKFQLKALAAALALAVTLPAHAAIDLPNTGNGSLILTLLDRVGHISATFDLGKNYSDFSVASNVAANTAVNGGFLSSNVDAAGTSFSWNLTQGDYAAAYTNYLTVGTLANTLWGVVAGDVIGSGNGGRGYISTTAGPNAGLSTAQVSSDQGTLNTYLAQANASGDPVFGLATDTGNHYLVANGAGTSIGGQSYGGASLFVQTNNLFAGHGAKSLNVVGADSGVVQFSTIGSSLTQANVYTFANNAHFNLSDTGLLTYSTTVAAVPEADTWAMMFMGLGLMGFIARRKQA